MRILPRRRQGAAASSSSSEEVSGSEADASSPPPTPVAAERPVRRLPFLSSPSKTSTTSTSTTTHHQQQQQDCDEEENRSCASPSGVAGGSQAKNSNVTVYHVSIPDHVRPGDVFLAKVGGHNNNNNNNNNNNSGGGKSSSKTPYGDQQQQQQQQQQEDRIIRIRCPANMQPGQLMQVAVKNEAASEDMNSPNVERTPPSPPAPRRLSSAASSGGGGRRRRHGGGSSGRRRSSRSSQDSDENEPHERLVDTYRVTIPAHVQPGKPFQVTIQGQELTVLCPPYALPGTQITIVPPPLLPSFSQPSHAQPPPSSSTVRHSQSAPSFSSSSSASLPTTSTSATSFASALTTLSSSSQPSRIHSAAAARSSFVSTASSHNHNSSRSGCGNGNGNSNSMMKTSAASLSSHTTNTTMLSCSSFSSSSTSFHQQDPIIHHLQQQYPAAMEHEEPQGAAAHKRPSSLPPQPPQPQPQPPLYNHQGSNRSISNPSALLYQVVVPQGVEPGQPFPLLANGVRLLVTCPMEAGPGQTIRFELPLSTKTTSTTSFSPQDQGQDGEQQQQQQHKNNAGAGTASTLLSNPIVPSPAAAIRLKYNDKDAWTRILRLSDGKFQWVRMDAKGAIDSQLARFDCDRSAYVCKVLYDPDHPLQNHDNDDDEEEDYSLRRGRVRLLPASHAVVDSTVIQKIKQTIPFMTTKTTETMTLVDYMDIANAQVKTYSEKAQWFQSTCKRLAIPWDEGHVAMSVRRSHILHDSVDAVLSLSKQDLHKTWRFEFTGEEGLDAGGLAREWFHLVTKQVLDPANGLWIHSESNQMCLQINPASHLICSDYLVYFRFLGRVMGKALFDGQLVTGHMVQYLYKHILGWPIAFKDLESIDQQYYSSLRQIAQLANEGHDLSLMCLTFTATQDVLGAVQEVELVKGGHDIEVDNSNWPEYLEACLRHRMLDRFKSQIRELLLGFYDVIPEPLLTVFDFQELELLMCGLPSIDVDDWRQNTDYTGGYESAHYQRQLPVVCQWFWDIVTDMDSEERARLLQFVTGTSGVPSRGFAFLHGNDGDIKRFTLHGVSIKQCVYPRAHTCFNRLDLPMEYKSREELEDRLVLAVTMSTTTGFDFE